MMHSISLAKYLSVLTLSALFSISAHAGGHADGEHETKDHKMEKHEKKKAEPAEVGEKAPEFTLKNSEGKDVSLTDFSGKLVVLEWTNHECPFVKKHYSSDNMQGLQKKYTAKDVVWLSIISSAPGKQGFVDGEEANKLTTDRGASPSHVLFDPNGAVGKQYDAKTTPHMYIVGKDGTLLYNGSIDSIKSANPADIAKAENYVVKALDEIMAGKAVSQPMTRPYGCSVKYKS